MAQKQDILDAIDASERQLFAIEEQVNAKATLPVGESNWSVRDMLCHVATTASVAELDRRIHHAQGAFPTGEEMDGYNAALRTEHQNDSVEDLFAVATRGFAQAREAVTKMSDEELAKPAPGDGSMTTGDLLAFVYMNHTVDHIATIERAVGAAS